MHFIGYLCISSDLLLKLIVYRNYLCTFEVSERDNSYKQQLFINILNYIIMRISKFTSKDALIKEIKNNTYFKSFEVSKLEDDNGAVFQIRTQSRVTLKDLSVLGLLHKDVSLVASDNREILLTWLEE